MTIITLWRLVRQTPARFAMQAATAFRCGATARVCVAQYGVTSSLRISRGGVLRTFLLSAH